MVATSMFGLFATVVIATAQIAQEKNPNTAPSVGTANSTASADTTGRRSQAVASASPDVAIQQETQRILKRWELWGALATVAISTLGGLGAAYIARPSGERKSENGVARGFALVLPAIGIAVLAAIVLFVLPSRVQPSHSGLSAQDISALARNEAKLEVSAANARLDRIVRTVDSLQISLSKLADQTSAMTQAAAATRQRLPTETYLLDGYSNMTRELNARSQDIERLRGELTIAAERQRFNTLIIAMAFFLFGSLAFGALWLYPRTRGFPAAVPRKMS